LGRSKNKVEKYLNVIIKCLQIDQLLELEIDVLDDVVGDSKQVFAANPWLTYGDSVHKMREFGASIKEMDLIDETKLSSEQMRVVCAML